MAQRLHRETLRSTAAPTSAASTNERHARLFDTLADKWRDLQTECDWRWMRATLDATLTIGQQTYLAADLGAADFRRWRPEDSTYSPGAYIDGAPNTLWDLNYWNLDAFRHQFIYRQLGQTTPMAWTWDEENRLLIGPAPAQAYKLRIAYWKKYTELAADDDTPDMPQEFHMLLVWEALMDIATSDAAPEILAKAQKNRNALRDRLVLDQKRLPYL